MNVDLRSLVVRAFQAYIVALGVLAVYSGLWVLDVARVFDRTLLAAAWIAVAGFGVFALIMLVPLYFQHRSL